MGCPPPQPCHCAVTFPKAELQPCPTEGSCWENYPSTLNGKNSWLKPRGNSRILKAIAGEASGSRGLPPSRYRKKKVTQRAESLSLTRQTRSQIPGPGSNVLIRKVGRCKDPPRDPQCRETSHPAWGYPMRRGFQNVPGKAGWAGQPL